MTCSSSRSLFRFGLLGACILAVAATTWPVPADAQDANALRSRHTSLRDKFATNQFGRPLALESAQSSGALKGDVYAVVDHPFAAVQRSLSSPEHWCDILILHLNVKRCKVAAGGKMLSVNVGRRFDQPLEDAYLLDLAYKVAATSADYLQVQLTADEGPMNTRDFRIVVEAIGVDARRSMLHMSYAYGYGMTARLAMQTYLATVGRDKVGFTILEQKPDGKPVYRGGVLGLLERNTMRYYLAIDAYLAAHTLPAGEQTERRLREWYSSTERYAPQLREMEQADYLDMKRKEIKRQQAG